VHHERLITGVAAVFAAIAIVLGVTALLTNPAVLFVALAFAAAAYLMYDQISGRMAARVYRRVEQRARVDGQRPGNYRANSRVNGRANGRTTGARGDGGHQRGTGGFGAGPREPWEPPRGGQAAREAAAREAAARRAATGRRGTATRRNRSGPGPTERAAYETLGVEPGADRVVERLTAPVDATLERRPALDDHPRQAARLARPVGDVRVTRDTVSGVTVQAGDRVRGSGERRGEIRTLPDRSARRRGRIAPVGGRSVTDHVEPAVPLDG
jgi:hypothetical protein